MDYKRIQGKLLCLKSWGTSLSTSMASARGTVGPTSMLSWRGSFYSPLDLTSFCVSAENPSTSVAELQ